jgi:hypothetical protein
VPTFADRGCCVVSAVDPHDHIETGSAFICIPVQQFFEMLMWTIFCTLFLVLGSSNSGSMVKLELSTAKYS